MICPACHYAMDAFDVTCPRCQGKGVSAPTQSTPPPAIPQQPSPTVPTVQAQPAPPQASANTNALGLCFGLGCGLPILAFFLIILIAAFSPESDAGETEAYVIAKEAITRQLQAPSTAKFPYSAEPGVAINDFGDEIIISSYVDAQNAFGATLRRRWTATLKRSSDRKRWRLIEASLNE